MGSFKPKTVGKVESIVSKLLSQKEKQDGILLKKMRKATEIVWRTATAKRPMMTRQQMKAEGRTRRVSDPAAKLGVPVRTGDLRASIHQEVKLIKKTLTGRVWTDWPYAAHVEFGTSKMKARPYMRPALFEQNDKIKEIFKNKDA